MVLYMAAYAILRFVVEFYRGVETRNLIFGTFSVAQLVSVIMVIFAVWIWVRQSRKAEGL